MKSSPIALPSPVRMAAESAVGGPPITEELAWMSWAGTVWRLTGRQGTLYVKRAADLAGENDRLAWLAARWPVPRVAGFFHEAGDDWLLTHAVPGLGMHDPALGRPPEKVALELGSILRHLHSVDATGCPFGTRRPGHVLIHGDYCLPNILVDEHGLSGVVDVGGAGMGNPEDDLAAGVWTLQYNYGKGLASRFLDAYGWPPMTDDAIEKLRRRYAR